MKTTPWCLLLALVAAGCTFDPARPSPKWAGVADTGVKDDAHIPDGGTPQDAEATMDTGVGDAGMDGGEVTPDADVDASEPDAETDGGVDAAQPDADVDAGADSGFPDAEVDGGEPDVGFPDSGEHPDATPVDTGAHPDAMVDAGLPDTGVDGGADSGFPDADVDGGVLDSGFIDGGNLDGGVVDPCPPVSGLRLVPVPVGTPSGTCESGCVSQEFSVDNATTNNCLPMGRPQPGMNMAASLDYDQAQTCIVNLNVNDVHGRTCRMLRVDEWRTAMLGCSGGQPTRSTPWASQTPPTCSEVSLTTCGTGVATSTIGSHPAGATPEGLHHAFGNNREWVESGSCGGFPNSRVTIGGDETYPLGASFGTTGCLPRDTSWGPVGLRVICPAL